MASFRIVALLLLEISQVLSSDKGPKSLGYVPVPMTADEYLESLLDEGGDLRKNMFGGEFVLNDGFVSGDFRPESNPDEVGIQGVMDMLFKYNFVDNNDTIKDLDGSKDTTHNVRHRPKKPRHPKGEDRRKNRKLSREDLLTGIEKLLDRNSNASFRVENGILIVEESSLPDYDKDPVKICDKQIYNVSDFNKLLEGMSTEDKSAITKLFRLFFNGNITRKQLTRRIAKYADKMPCYHVTTVFPTTSSSLLDFQLVQLREIVEDGYAEESLLKEVQDGKVTIDEARVILMKNKDFVISRFPAKIEEMLEDKRIPEEIEKQMFSGKLTLTELKDLMYQEDSIAKAVLPERVRQILEERFPTRQLKDMLIEGHNSSAITEMVMENETMLEDLMSESMFYFYLLFKEPRNVRLNMALSAIVIVALCFVMASLGCTMTVTEIMNHVRRPKGVLIALFSQYGIMPAAAFGLTQLFDLRVYPAIAVLICGCCPGGNLSNMLAFAINGDMNLSILMTTCSSVLGLAMMPLLLYCYSRFIIPVDSSEIVPFDKIILNIALTIVPVSIGIAIKHYRPTWTRVVMKCGAVVLVLCSIAFAIIAGFLLGDKFFTYFPVEVVICAAILPITGYILGFVFARLVRENQKASRTISVETGCQNVQLCGTVLKLAFDPILIGAVMLLPIIYMGFQAAEASLLITLYRFYERCTKKKKGNAEEITFDDEQKKLEKSDSETKVAEQSDKDVEGKNVNIINKSDQNGDGNGTKQDNSEQWPLVPNSALDAFEKSKENYV